MANKKKVLIIGAGAAGMVVIHAPITLNLQVPNNLLLVLRVYFVQSPGSF